MYSIIFTSFLVIILIWKLIKLRKCKRTLADYESLDEDFMILLNEGDYKLSAPKRTTYRFQMFKMCKKCTCYSVLKDENCPECGTSYAGVESLAKSICKSRIVSEAIAILLFVGIGTVFTPTMKIVNYTLFAGLSFFCTYVLLTFLFIKKEYYQQLKKLFYADLIKIKAGIAQDTILAMDDINHDRAAAAYDKLLDISDLIYSDQVKILCVRALNKMTLRKDMMLVLEPLIPTSYDKDFVKYALKVLKIKRTLITKRCIAYFINYQSEVIRDFGMESFLTVAGMTLKMKLYILEFADFIEGFIEFLPKERLLRLCRIMNSHPKENWGSLGEKTKRLIALKYSYDPDFKPYCKNRVGSTVG